MPPRKRRECEVNFHVAPSSNTIRDGTEMNTVTSRQDNPTRRWVNDMSLSADALDEAGSGLAEVAAEFAEELGGAPTLAEFLELLGWALPMNSDATDGTFHEPLKFKVVLTEKKPYHCEAPSRVGELNDHLFEDAREHHAALVERMYDASDAPVTPQQFASAILQVLRSGRIVLADVKGEDVRKLTADVPKKRVAKPKPGDVLAIPARTGGYHMAVVLAHNCFGMAVGLFRGTSAQGRLDAGLRAAARKYPVHTDRQLVADGTWKVVDHDEGLLALFPSAPCIYHRPDAWKTFGGSAEEYGEFGAAETSDGTMRLIGPDEAREIGLQDGTYRGVILGDFLQRILDDEADPAATAPQRLR